MTDSACGVIGLGNIGRLYCRLVAKEGARLGLRIAAAADPASTNAPEGVELYADHRAMLERADIGAVLVASPPSLHYEHASDSLQAGKGVLVEKPPGRTVREAEQLARLASSAQRVLFFAFHARYGCAVSTAKSRLERQSVAIGNLEVEYAEDVTRYHARESWVYDEGVLRDSGINVFSVLTYLAREPIAVAAAKLRRSPAHGAITRAKIDLRVGRESRGRIRLDWEHAGTETRTLRMRVDEEEWLIDIGADRLLIGGIAVNAVDAPNSLEREYGAMLEHFSRALAARESVVSTDELRLVEEAERLAHV